MKKIILLFTIILTIFFIYNSSNAQLGWKQINTGFSGRLYSICMTTISDIHTCGEDGRIYRSLNFGLNWTRVNQNSAYYLTSISFADVYTGIAVGSGGKILRTTNAGGSWNEVSSGITNVLTSVSMSPDGTGLICGDAGKVLKTQNYGANWVQQYTGNTSMFFTCKNFNGGAIGFACGDGGKIYKTTLAGVNWGQIAQFGGVFKSSSFLNDQQGWVIGSALYRTNNGGTSWDTLQTNLSGINSIFFTNSSCGFMVGSGGLIFRTNDGGRNWTLSQSSTFNDLQSIYMLNEYVGVACGATGTVLWTENSGVGVEQISSEIPRNFKLHQNYPNPFNPATKINFEILNSGFVEIKIFDVAGREVETLANQNFNSGKYVVNWNSKSSPAGIYLYTLNFFSSTGEKRFTSTKKMMLVK